MDQSEVQHDKMVFLPNLPVLKYGNLLMKDVVLKETDESSHAVEVLSS